MDIKKAASKAVRDKYMQEPLDDNCQYNRDSMEKMFLKGAEWQREQPIPQNIIDEKLTEFFKSEEINDVLRVASYTLICVSTMAIDVNSSNTEISIEFTHKSGKKYKSEMLVTQHEISKQ